MIHTDSPFYMISFDRGGVLYLRGVSVVAGLLWRAAIATGWCFGVRGGAGMEEGTIAKVDAVIEKL